MEKLLKEYISYSPESGEFTWIKSPSAAVPVGSKTGFKGDRYARIQFKGKQLLAHRVAWFFTYGEVPSMIDHINGDPFDNRLCNLRASNAFLNSRNRESHRKGKLFGAHLIRGKYHGSFSREKKVYFVGVFDSEKEASAAVFGYLKAKGWLEEKHLVDKTKE